MKKTFMLTTLVVLATTLSCYAADTVDTKVQPQKENSAQTMPAPPEFRGHKRPPVPPEVMQKKKAEFEKRLKLTDEQKQEAKELRVKGHEEMKPLMEQIKTKHDKIKTIKQQSLTESEKEQIQALKNEIRELDKQVRDLRMKNMKEFESILTEKQQKELKKMKEEGRKNFEKRHKDGRFNPPMPAPEGNPPAENEGGPSENPEK